MIGYRSNYHNSINILHIPYKEILVLKNVCAFYDTLVGIILIRNFELNNATV